MTGAFFNFYTSLFILFIPYVFPTRKSRDKNKVIMTKNNFRCFPFLPGHCQIAKDQILCALEHYSTSRLMVQLAESLIIAKPILEIIKQAWAEEWFSFVKLT